jgi:hypothetical protein
MSFLRNVTKGVRPGWILWINDLKIMEDMRFGAWIIISTCLYRAGSLRTVAEGISKYTIDLRGVQEARFITH